MHGLTLDEQRALLRSFDRIFLTLTVICAAIGGFLYFRGETRAAMILAGVITPVPLLCFLMQRIEVAQLEKRR